MKQEFKILGNIKCKITNQSSLTLKQWAFNKDLKEKLLKGLIDKKEFLAKFIFGDIRLVTEQHNLIATTGLTVIARVLANDTTYSGFPNIASLGTGTTAPALSDTKLETETYRNEQFSASYTGTKALLTAFYDSGECSGTFKEFGNFIDGLVATADSGQLFSHLATNWTKNDIDTMTVSQEYTIINV